MSMKEPDNQNQTYRTMKLRAGSFDGSPRNTVINPREPNKYKGCGGVGSDFPPHFVKRLFVAK